MKSSSSLDDSTPEAYQIGCVPFLGATIWLDSKPLIPRTETEWWVEQFIGRHKARSSKLETIRCIDLFAGSGCIGVAILTHLPEVHVDFGELEARHLPTIKKNCEINGVLDRARVIQTDVWESLTDTYDFVLANPPYLSRSKIERVQDSVLAHEPHESLFAKEDGFALIERTLRGLPAYLHKGGEAWVEHEPEHTTRILALAQSLGYTATTHKDQYGVQRYSVIL